MRMAPHQQPEFVIGGMQSIRFQIGREARISRNTSARNVVAAGFDSMFAVVAAQSNNSKKQTLAALIAQGKTLFFSGTFRGNGRTCGTCHRENRNLTIDIDFIDGLPSTDRLFVTELDPTNLPGFNPLNPNQPAMEDPVMMRTRGLILENIEGFARVNATATGDFVNPPFFRAPPSLFNLEFNGAPYGLSGCCADLQSFATAAVIQHFTKTLTRAVGTDFVLPTSTELKALEAFMLSNTSPANGNFKISGRNSLLSTRSDPRATDTTRAEVRGRDLFETVGCTACHLGPVGTGGSVNLDTGVEALEHALTLPHTPTPTLDTGDGAGQFQIPQLFGLRKNQFFHTGLLGNKTVALSLQTLQFTNLRDAVSFYVTDQFLGSPGGLETELAFPGTLASLANMSPADIDDIAHFLEAISNP
jgi:cytochrome c peroxidase